VKKDKDKEKKEEEEKKKKEEEEKKKKEDAKPKASPWARWWREAMQSVFPLNTDDPLPLQDPEVRKFVAALWKDVTAWATEQEIDSPLLLFRAEPSGRVDTTGAIHPRGPEAEWALIPATDLLVTVGEGIVGVTVEGITANGPKGFLRETWEEAKTRLNKKRPKKEELCTKCGRPPDEHVDSKCPKVTEKEKEAEKEKEKEKDKVEEKPRDRSRSRDKKAAQSASAADKFQWGGGGGDAWSQWQEGGHDSWSSSGSHSGGQSWGASEWQGARGQDKGKGYRNQYDKDVDNFLTSGGSGSNSNHGDHSRWASRSPRRSGFSDQSQRSSGGLLRPTRPPPSY